MLKCLVCSFFLSHMATSMLKSHVWCESHLHGVVPAGPAGRHVTRMFQVAGTARWNDSDPLGVRAGLQPCFSPMQSRAPPSLDWGGQSPGGQSLTHPGLCLGPRLPVSGPVSSSVSWGQALSGHLPRLQALPHLCVCPHTTHVSVSQCPPPTRTLVLQIRAYPDDLTFMNSICNHPLSK